MQLRRRRPLVYQLPPVVELPTGNCQVVPLQRPELDPTIPLNGNGSGDGADVERPVGWVIVDGQGRFVGEPLETRAAALREMGAIAFRGAELPLTLFGPDGRATGDRLA